MVSTTPCSTVWLTVVMSLAAGTSLLLCLVPSAAGSTDSEHMKRAACRLICSSDSLEMVRSLCPCGIGQRAVKRWGMGMDLDGDMGSMGWKADADYDAAAAEDAGRHIFRFGKRVPEKKWSKKWSMADDLSMALPWELDNTMMADEDRAGGKIFRFGKRSERSSEKESKE